MLGPDPAPGSISHPDNDRPCGYLLKAGEGGMLRSSSLKRRWFVLDTDDGVLSYYKSEECKRRDSFLCAMQSADFATSGARAPAHRHGQAHILPGS